MSPQKDAGIFHNFLEAITNIFIFLPYFFSVNTLSKTLFSPWKNLTAKKTQKGFSFGDLGGRLMFGFISRGIGMLMRLSIIIFYLLLQMIYVLIIPVIFIIFLFLYPVLIFMKKMSPDESEKRNKMKVGFISTHMLSDRNYRAVEQWFEYIYEHRFGNTPWWKLSQLTKMPPLARDWATGYTPTLDEFGQDLTSTPFQMSIRGHIIGREKESALIERVLSQSAEANVLLIGDEGVGKHTIMHAFAKKMYEGKTNTSLAYKRLFKLNMEKIVSVYTDPLQREQFVETLLKEASESKNVVLLIDNIDKYLSEDHIAGDSRIDLTTALTTYAKTDALQIIGITTPFLYEKYIYHNERIRSMFAKVDVEEVSRQTAYMILLEKVLMFEDLYDITIPYETVLAILEKGSYYITTVPFPENALQLLDWVSVYAVQTAKQKVVNPELIDVVITGRTHAPTTLTPSIKQTLLHLEETLETQILGQHEAIQEISSSLRRAFVLIGKRKKPLASFLFLGTTGVGKTETSKVICNVFFGDESKLIRFDMSLYQSKEDIPQLVGSIETLNPGLLTNAVRENPYGVLLIDEIEKAHKDLLNIFLTVLDEGYFTDGFGQKVDCKNLIIVATSNAGSEDIHQLLLKKSLSEEATKNGPDAIIDYLIEKHYFSPEFLNRFDGIIAYKPLDEGNAMQIARGIVADMKKQMYELHRLQLEISDQTLEELIKKGYNASFGVRNLERIIKQHIEDRVAKLILEEKATEESIVRI
jgi:ATP-dependent Clp protease ATP-binding subunit ClpA